MKHLLLILFVLMMVTTANGATFYDTLEVTAVGSIDLWSLISGTTKVDAVDHDDDAKYIQEETQGEKQRYTLENMPAIKGTGTLGEIQEVKVFVRISTNKTTPIMRSNLELGGSITNGTTRSCTASWVTHSEVLARPGGGAWTTTNIDDLTVEVEMTYGIGGRYPQCSRLWVEIKYTDAIPVGDPPFQGMMIPVSIN